MTGKHVTLLDSFANTGSTVTHAQAMLDKIAGRENLATSTILLVQIVFCFLLDGYMGHY